MIQLGASMLCDSLLLFFQLTLTINVSVMTAFFCMQQVWSAYRGARIRTARGNNQPCWASDPNKASRWSVMKHSAWLSVNHFLFSSSHRALCLTKRHFSVYDDVSPYAWWFCACVCGGTAVSDMQTAIPVFMTKKERKKLRKQGRQEAQRDLQEKIRIGLAPVPEPKGLWFRRVPSSPVWDWLDRCVADLLPSFAIRRMLDAMVGWSAARISSPTVTMIVGCRVVDEGPPTNQPVIIRLPCHPEMTKTGLSDRAWLLTLLPVRPLVCPCWTLLLLNRLINRQDAVFCGFGRRSP